jgi:hypothetical protein
MMLYDPDGAYIAGPFADDASGAASLGAAVMRFYRPIVNSTPTVTSGAPFINIVIGHAAPSATLSELLCAMCGLPERLHGHEFHEFETN